ncbi:MAG: N-acetylmuramoyl-L-alanine amidase [Clostridiaceae bacterium]|nr:N-acetylmuramoyl-L-alanine amidase [Clostridiaceae bacterium]
MKIIGIKPRVKVQLVPIGNPNRPGRRANMKWVTIHNTANPNSTAQNERDYVQRRRDNVSFHYAVDDKEAIAIIPEEEIARHTGTTEGNNSSIGIEVCESGDQERTYLHAVGLTASILLRYGWGIDRIRTHEAWNGKNCPRLLLPKWEQFLHDVEETIWALKMEVNKEDWKREGIEYLHSKEILQDKEKWLDKLEEPMPVWATTLLLKRVHEASKK